MAVSFEAPEYTANVDALGTLRILEAVRISGLSNKTRIYQASTSELYDLVKEVPNGKPHPSTHAAHMEFAKLYAYWITVNYRESLWNVCSTMVFCSIMNHHAGVKPL